MTTKILNTDGDYKKIVIVTREIVELAPGEEIEFEGDLELV